MRSLYQAVSLKIPVAFEYLGHKGSLQLMFASGQVSHMRVGFHYQKPLAGPGFVRLISKPAFDMVLNTGGWPPVSTGLDRLDDAFMIFASTALMAKELTAPRRVDAFLALGKELGGFPVGITFGKSILHVEKVCYSDRPQDQLRMIYRVIDLLEELVGIPAARQGEIPEGRPPAMDTSRALCQVCLNLLTARVVYCAGCVTPHHKECWDYVGGCSTYACLRRTYTADADAYRDEPAAAA